MGTCGFLPGKLDAETSLRPLLGERRERSYTAGRKVVEDQPMDSFAYHLAWVILAIHVTLVLFIGMYIVGRVERFAQFLWQKYVRSKIKRRLIEMHKIAPDELYKKDKFSMLREGPYFGPPTQMLKKATKTTRKGAATGKEIEEFAGKTRG